MTTSPRAPRIPGCLHLLLSLLAYVIVGIFVTKYVTIPLGDWAAGATGPAPPMGNLKALFITVFWPFAFLFSVVMASIRALGEFYRA